MHINVVFLGPDGVGKTTLIAAVHEATASYSKTAYFGLGKDGWRLAFARRLAMGQKSTLRRHLFWYAAFPCEIILRRLHMLTDWRRRVVLVDRLPGLPIRAGGVLGKLYSVILPTPRVIFLLVGDPAVIAARKPCETSTQRTIKEIRKWGEVARRFGRSRIIELDTTMLGTPACKARVIEELEHDPVIHQALLGGTRRRVGIFVRKGVASDVVVVGRLAVKVFHGPGAQWSFMREREGLALALQSPEWSARALPVRFRPLRVTTAVVCESAEGAAFVALEGFVKRLVGASMSIESTPSGPELIPARFYAYVLGKADPTERRAIEAALDRHFPTGPTHGDLHRGNMLVTKKGLRIIDFGRFSKYGCPLVDLLHFYLSEAQRETRMPWLTLLLARPDIAERVASEHVDTCALMLFYSIQRVGYEMESAAARERSLEKYDRQIRTLIEHCSSNHAD